ncbi:MAG TPA: YtxH domain-containing protein [Acidiferrobacterales bacterium]|nr:YtxH domain-containing protein [Acidiferrobacterales bacterium]
MNDQEYISSPRLIASFLGGVAFGYGVALLFAPRTGKETRAMIGEYAQSTGETLSNMARRAADSAKEAAESAKQKAGEYAEAAGQKAGEYVDKAKGQARATSSEVEQRLKTEKQPSRNQ